VSSTRSKRKREEDGEEGDIRAENAEMRINIAGLSSAPMTVWGRGTYSSLAQTFLVCLLLISSAQTHSTTLEQGGEGPNEENLEKQEGSEGEREEGRKR